MIHRVQHVGNLEKQRDVHREQHKVVIHEDSTSVECAVSSPTMMVTRIAATPDDKKISMAIVGEQSTEAFGIAPRLATDTTKN